MQGSIFRSSAASAASAAARIDTPVGPLTVEVTSRGLRSVRWDDDDRTPGGEAELPDGMLDEAGILGDAVAQLCAYLAGERLTFDLPLDEAGTPFQLAAWSTLRTIPFGETLSYGGQAARLGDPRKARAIGGANGRNPIAIVTPCHRVVGADGSLTGFAAGTDRKRWLLDHEAEVLASRRSA